MVSLEQFLEQTARRGTWYGGGSAAALTCALAAALLEKLADHRSARGRLRSIRTRCVSLVERDARAFARVIAASRSGDPHAFRRTLKAATEIPCRVFEHAQAIRAASRAAASSIKPKLQSDLKGARAMAVAAAEAARALIDANLTWLNERPYTRTIRLRLRAAKQRHGP